MTLDDIPTPALLIRLDRVRGNLDRMVELLDGRIERWRPHVKTAKIPEVLDLMLRSGVRRFKCATTREAQVLLERCDEPVDLLIAMAHRGPNLRRVAELAERFGQHRLSILVEDPDHAGLVRRQLPGVETFIDLDPGFGRTGVPCGDPDRIRATALAAGSTLRGLHDYEGHVRSADPGLRAEACDTIYGELLAIADDLARAGVTVDELITSGTPTFRDALRYPAFADLDHQVGPGTVVYWDTLSEDFGIGGFHHAATVLTRVVSAPGPRRRTLDAGSKAVDAAAGTPCVRVVGWPHLLAGVPSEEHLPLSAESGPLPEPGELLELLPAHVCPTVNLADRAVLLEPAAEPRVVPVAARGHEI